MLLSGIHLQCTTRASGGSGANNKQTGAEYSISQKTFFLVELVSLSSPVISSVTYWDGDDLALLAQVCAGVGGAMDIWWPLDAPTHTY